MSDTQTTKLQVGDVIEVHGWVMLQGLDAGKYVVTRVEEYYGQPTYSFRKRGGRKTAARHYAGQVDAWIRPVGDPDINRIEIVGSPTVKEKTNA
jgi:hypothetical protein